MTSADFITALLCHTLLGLGLSSLHTDMSDRYINPQQLQLLTANPPLTQMNAHTKTQTNSPTPCDQLTGTKPRLYIRPIGSAVPQQRSLQCRGVLCVSQWSSKERVFWGELLPTHSARWRRSRESQQAEEQRGSQGSWVLVADQFPVGSAVKHWREQQQQCFFASLDWPLDILDTSRCVKCLGVTSFLFND